MQYYEDSQYNGYQHEAEASAPFFTASSQVFVTEPLNYHLYTETIPPTFMPSSVDSHFLPPSADYRQLLHTRSHSIRSLPPPGLNLPEDLQGYHSLAPLEATTAQDRRKLGNWYSSVYRAINSTDGAPYCLRRVENFRLMHHSAFHGIEAWSKIRHPNIVSVKEAFTTKAFNDSSLVVAYAYHPGAKTLFDAHIKIAPPTFQSSFHTRSQLLVQSQPTVLPERTLWSYIIQIASAMRRVHESGLAVRMIDATKILVTGKNRIRIGSCGTFDVLTHDVHQDLHALMQEDVSAFGRLLLSLCCNSLSAGLGPNYNRSMDTVTRLYSPELKSLVNYLTSKNNLTKHINHVFDMIGGRIAMEMEDALCATDRLEHELMSELENARLVRLLCKFGFINERPEFARDPRWSDTGDRYIIKLFRDYVFHQVDENGNPVTNLSHVLTCLNKLDAGTDEKVMLVARDEQSCLVVSYKDMKACIESAFSELAQYSSSNSNGGLVHNGSNYRL